MRTCHIRPVAMLMAPLVNPEYLQYCRCAMESSSSEDAFAGTRLLRRHPVIGRNDRAIDEMRFLGGQ